MINWQYNPEDYNKITPITPGTYRVRIENAEEQVSKTGRDMIKMTLKVSGHNQFVWHYLVFIQENAQMTNDRLGRIFDSFDITPGDMNLEHWKGKVGAAEIKNEVDDQGTMQTRIKFFIQHSKQDGLPMWQEHPVKQINTNTNPDMFNPDDVLF